MTEFLALPKFKKEFERLSKKFRTLQDDFDTFNKALSAALPDELGGTKRISNLGSGVCVPVFKFKHFRCRTLSNKGSRSGIRIIYAYDQAKNKVLFLEIYYKGEKANEDRRRILEVLQGKDSL